MHRWKILIENLQGLFAGDGIIRIPDPHAHDFPSEQCAGITSALQLGLCQIEAAYVDTAAHETKNREHRRRQNRNDIALFILRQARQDALWILGSDNFGHSGHLQKPTVESAHAMHVQIFLGI